MCGPDNILRDTGEGEVWEECIFFLNDFATMKVNPTKMLEKHISYKLPRRKYPTVYFGTKTCMWKNFSQNSSDGRKWCIWAWLVTLFFHNFVQVSPGFGWLLPSQSPICGPHCQAQGNPENCLAKGKSSLPLLPPYCPDGQTLSYIAEWCLLTTFVTQKTIHILYSNVYHCLL